MLQTLKTIANLYNRYMTIAGRKKALAVLLNSNDRMLKDAGFSRELLEKGVEAWPWREENSDHDLPAINYRALETKKAVREVSEYSETELHDLGITRGKIKDAAQYGRSEIDDSNDRKVA